MKFSTIADFLFWALMYRKSGEPVQYYRDKDFKDWFINNRPHLKQYQNIHDGKGCFIIGNGPSLNRTNLVALNDYFTIGLNKIHLIFETQSLQ